MNILRALLALSSLMFMPVAYAANPDFTYTTNSDAAAVIDTRALATCETASLANARCLPAKTFLGPHGRLANFRDILWIFGTVGLKGDERVLVIGDDRVERDFVAGLLYLAGQAQIEILTDPPKSNAMTQGGTSRSISREKIFQTPMRDRYLVLRNELATWVNDRISLSLLDGRNEKEYWGATVRGIRGGHLPGATSLPLHLLRKELGTQTAVLPLAPEPIAYGHNAQQGIAYFTLLHAGAGVDARVFPGGWAAWAANGALPADSVTYPERTGNVRPSPSKRENYGGRGLGGIIAGLTIGGILTAFGFLIGRRTTT